MRRELRYGLVLGVPRWIFFPVADAFVRRSWRRRVMRLLGVRIALVYHGDHVHRPWL